MPLISNNLIARGVKLGIWKISEEVEELEAVFPLLPEEKEQYQKIKNEKRKKEWLIARILLTELIEKRQLITYSPHGKPYILNSQTNLSITHSKNFVGVIISAQLIPGIDIENIATRVEKVKHKFLSTEELVWCNSTELMTICWSAKEAIFKIHEKELDFHDIVINKFASSDLHFTANTIKKENQQHYKVLFEKIEEDILTYVLHS